MARGISQVYDFKKEIVSGGNLSTPALSTSPAGGRNAVTGFGEGALIRLPALHTFCGKECAQASLCWLKCLIRQGLRSVPAFVADPAPPMRGRPPVPRHRCKRPCCLGAQGVDAAPGAGEAESLRHRDSSRRPGSPCRAAPPSQGFRPRSAHFLWTKL